MGDAKTDNSNSHHGALKHEECNFVVGKITIQAHAELGETVAGTDEDTYRRRGESCWSQSVNDKRPRSSFGNLDLLEEGGHTIDEKMKCPRSTQLQEVIFDLFCRGFFVLPYRTGVVRCEEHKGEHAGDVEGETSS